MKIEFTEHRNLDELGRIVKPGEVIESSETVSKDLLQAYVNNGIAREITPGKPKIIDGGE